MSGNSSGRHPAAETTGMSYPGSVISTRGSWSRSFRKFTSEREDSCGKPSEGPEGGSAGSRNERLNGADVCTLEDRHRVGGRGCPEACVRGPALPARPHTALTADRPQGTRWGLLLARPGHLRPVCLSHAATSPGASATAFPSLWPDASMLRALLTLDADPGEAAPPRTSRDEKSASSPSH